MRNIRQLFMSLIIAVCFMGVQPTTAQTPDTQIDVSYYVQVISWSPDGQLIAVLGSDGLFVYTPNLQEVAHIQKDQTRYAASLSWKPDSTGLASIGNGSILIWNRDQDNNFSLDRALHLDGYLQVLISWSPDGARLASQDLPDDEDLRGLPSRVHTWNTSIWTIEHTFAEEYSYGEEVYVPFALRWNADGSQLAVAGFDHNEGVEAAYVYDVRLGKRILVVPQSDPVSMLDWNGSGLLAVGTKWAVAIYDVKAEQTIYWIDDIEHLGKLEELAWSPDSTTLLLFTEKGTQILDPKTDQVLAHLPNGNYLWTWSPTGKQIAAAGVDQKTLHRILRVVKVRV
jgi:WD40 repeat protein